MMFPNTVEGDESQSWPCLITKASFQYQDWVSSSGLLVKVGLCKSPKQPRLLARQWVALHKLTERPHCCRQHPHNSHNTERYSWYLHRTFTSMSQCLWYRKVLCTLPIEKCKHQFSHKPLD